MAESLFLSIIVTLVGTVLTALVVAVVVRAVQWHRSTTTPGAKFASLVVVLLVILLALWGLFWIVLIVVGSWYV